MVLQFPLIAVYDILLSGTSSLNIIVAHRRSLVFPYVVIFLSLLTKLAINTDAPPVGKSPGGSSEGIGGEVISQHAPYINTTNVSLTF